MFSTTHCSCTCAGFFLFVTLWRQKRLLYVCLIFVLESNDAFLLRVYVVAKYFLNPVAFVSKSNHALQCHWPDVMLSLKKVKSISFFPRRPSIIHTKQMISFWRILKRGHKLRGSFVMKSGKQRETCHQRHFHRGRWVNRPLCDCIQLSYYCSLRESIYNECFR